MRKKPLLSNYIWSHQRGFQLLLNNFFVIIFLCSNYVTLNSNIFGGFLSREMSRVVLLSYVIRKKISKIVRIFLFIYCLNASYKHFQLITCVEFFFLRQVVDNLNQVIQVKIITCKFVLIAPALNFCADDMADKIP